MKTISSTDITNAGEANLQNPLSNEMNFQKVLPPALCDRDSLVFISESEQFTIAKKNGANGFIILEKIYAQIQPQLTTGMAAWTTKSIQQAMTSILPLFDRESQYLKQGVHPTAIIHPTAVVSASAHIGPYCVIGANAKISDHTILTAHVYIGSNCEIGRHCIFAPFVSVGQDGFGFFTDKNFHHHKIPQIGNVVIEDNCEFGAHCAVDRATLTTTRIQQGSKFDNFCHIAHNVQFGENALITAGFIVAGSTIIGKNLTTAGGVHMNGHIRVADHVTLSARAGVLQDIETSGVYGGYPLEPHKDSIKTLMSLPHLKDLRKQVTKILKHLQLNNEE